ncbi:MAG: hypothetical protein I8H76_02730 [Burkholderiales bacterium]|nr:hypothetical protein [Burkholderiales bacterium]MBH2015083.1 hypothetical protein [Burkholderiales bacterium]
MATSKKKPKAAKPILDSAMGRPNGSDLYIWCDFIELRCLVDKDRKFSRGRLLEILDETAQMHGEQTDADVVTLPDEALVAAAFDADDEDDAAGDVIAAGQVGTRNEMRVAGWFANLAFRAKIFGEAYPFKLSDDGQELEVQPVDTSLRKLYVQMLMSASLRLVPKDRRDELTESFEETSHEIFKQLMPRGWEVHRFGAKGASRYEGLLFDKLTALCKDLRGRFQLQKKDFKPNDRGDGGLDLVAWHPMGGDERDGLPVALAQCGCTSEGDAWSKKSLEAAPAKLRPHIHLLHPWSAYYFMPHDLTEATGNKIDWQQRANLTETIIIDRSRLIRLASLYESVDQCVTAEVCVIEALALAY